MWYVDDWHDLIRVASFLLCVFSLAYLGRTRTQDENAHRWSRKTKDLWLAMVMWSITGIALAIEGLSEDRPLEPRPIFYFIASVMTTRGVFRKGRWGGTQT